MSKSFNRANRQDDHNDANSRNGRNNRQRRDKWMARRGARAVEPSSSRDIYSEMSSDDCMGDCFSFEE